MRFEQATIEDISQLTALRIAFLQEDSGLTPEQLTVIQRDLPSYFMRHLNHDLLVFVAREEAEIVSCAFLLLEEKPMGPSFINGKTGTVFDVYTKPALRRQGLAKQVVSLLLENAAALALCVVELKATAAGYPLYRKLGFQDEVIKYRRMTWKNSVPS